MRSAQTNRHVPPCAVSETSQTARELSAPVGGRALGLRSEGSWLAAGLQLSCCAPGSSPALLNAVRAGRAYARPRAQGAPRPRPARAPRMRRGARARAPALPVPARPGPSFCPISQPRVCPESRRSRRELSNKVLYVIVTWFSALKWRCRGQNFLPGLRPGPRGRTGLGRTLGRVRGVLGGAAVHQYGSISHAVPGRRISTRFTEIGEMRG